MKQFSILSLAFSAMMLLYALSEYSLASSLVREYFVKPRILVILLLLGESLVFLLSNIKAAKTKRRSLDFLGVAYSMTLVGILFLPIDFKSWLVTGYIIYAGILLLLARLLKI